MEIWEEGKASTEFNKERTDSGTINLDVNGSKKNVGMTRNSELLASCLPDILSKARVLNCDYVELPQEFLREEFVWL